MAEIETVLAVVAPALLPLLSAPERLSVSTTSTPLLHAYRCETRTLVLRPTAVVEVDDDEEDEEGQQGGQGREPPHQQSQRAQQQSQRALVVAGSVYVARRRHYDPEPDQEQQQTPTSPTEAHDPITTLLARQRCLSRLVVGDARALAAVARTAALAPAPTAAGGLHRLTALVLEELGTDAAAIRAVARALEQGGMPQLEVLEVRESARPDDRTLPIMGALRRGACPLLRRLALGTRLGLPALDELAEALEARRNHKCPQQLAALTLSIGAQGFPSAAACREAVARVVGACRASLSELSVEGFGPIAEGVYTGLVDTETSPTTPKGAPRLRRLRCALVLFEAQEHGAGSIALARGLAEEGLAPALEALDWSGLQLKGPAFAALVGGVEAGTHLTALRELRLASAGLTFLDMVVLTRGWVRGAESAAWRRLTRLDLSGNRALGSTGIAILAEHLGPGRALAGLEELGLERCDRGEYGAATVFVQLCRGRSKPTETPWRLRKLNLGGCGCGPDTMLGLRLLMANGGGRGAWADSLTWLALPKNPLNRGHLELAAALVAAGPKLALERLDVWATGLSKEGALALAEALARPDGAVAPRLVAVDIDNQHPRLEETAEASLHGALLARQRARRRGGGRPPLPPP